MISRARALKSLTRYLDFALLGALLFLFVRLCPKEILNALPATGGDTGSHFWPLQVLVEQGLPNFSVRSWNPGNLGGEPHFVHYFPLPYLLMALLSIVFPIGTSFNLGTYIPVLFFPLSAYFAARLMKLRWPTPILFSLAATYCVMNTGYNMWGGNILSTLAGQFAHLYALNFILLGVGAATYELRKGKRPLFTALFFSCVVISHSYIMLGIPLFVPAFLLLKSSRSRWEVFRFFLIAGCGTFLLSVWFLLPMLENAKWTTPFSMVWISKKLYREAFPALLDPILWAGSAGVLLLCARRAWKELSALLIWLVPAVGYLGYYFIFPKLGLVDIRALPQSVLFMALASATAFGSGLRWLSPSLTAILLPLIFGASIWPLREAAKEGEGWMRWNYSGWEAKKLNPERAGLSEELRGNFSEGRVAYEHSDLSRAAGTERVFEMLPYFASRATLESLYMQATILSLPVYFLQSEISRHPSCPFPELKCVHPTLKRARAHLNLLGVTDLILVDKDLLKQADASPWLKKKSSFTPWIHYQNLDNPKLVEVLNQSPAISAGQFKKEFYDWFLVYNGTQRHLLSLNDSNIREPQTLPFQLEAATSDVSNCSPTVAVDFRGLSLKTDCPGKLHLLKFAFHSTWRASTGDDLFLLSPGYIGIIPSESEVRLTWGASKAWQISGYISLVSYVLAILCLGLRARPSLRSK